MVYGVSLKRTKIKEDGKTTVSITLSRGVRSGGEVIFEHTGTYDRGKDIIPKFKPLMAGSYEGDNHWGSIYNGRDGTRDLQSLCQRYIAQGIGPIVVQILPDENHKCTVLQVKRLEEMLEGSDMSVEELTRIMDEAWQSKHISL